MGFYLLDNPNPNTQQWTYPRRGNRGKLTGTCIVHTSESVIDHVGADTGAEGCASFIARRTDYGSYHRLVDSDSIINMLPFEYEAWQDSETNNWAVGLSCAVRAGEWNTIEAGRRDRIYRNIATVAAEFVTYMRTKGIEVPRIRINGAQARAGIPGFCAHGDSGLNRSDPGVQFEWDRFFRYINEILEGDDMPSAKEIAVEVANEVFNRSYDRQGYRDGTTNLGGLLANQDSNLGMIPVGVWSYANPSVEPRDVYQMLRDIDRQLTVQKELVTQLAVQQGVVIDYQAIAKAVLDEEAKRLAE